MLVRWTCVPSRCPNACWLLLLVVPALLPAAYAQEIRFEGGRFHVIGWNAPASPPAAGWASVLRVYTGEVSSGTPAMLGTYDVRDGQLSFQPRFPISPGVRVTAILTVPRGAPIEQMFTTAAAAVKPATRVLAVYPSGGVVPQNLLKLYIEFSAPMSRGEAWRHLRLVKADGSAVELPFLEIDQELWDAEGKRLTVLFDPGRIKRGVLPRDEIGPALEAGKTYELAVDAGWRDATGSPLSAAYRKPLRVAEEDRIAIDPAEWRLNVPGAGTRDPLVIRFPEPLDYALLQRLLAVDGVNGHRSIAAGEQEWRFIPEQPWQAGQYRVTIDTALEDLAGNRVGRVFDVDTFERVTSRITQRTVSLPFRIGSQQSERRPR